MLTYPVHEICYMALDGICLKFFWGVLLARGGLFPRLLFFTRPLGVFFGVRLVRIGLLGEARHRFGRSWVSP